MSLKWNESEYNDFVAYMIKAISEEEDVKNILKQLFIKTTINTTIDDETKSYKKEKIQMQQKIEELQNENAKLEEELKKYKTEYTKNTIILDKIGKELQQKTFQLENEIEKNNALNLQLTKLDNINTSFKEQINKLQEENNKLKSHFMTEVNLFQCYKNLSASLKNSLSGIFRGSTVEEFIFCGVQKQNIELLWDAIKIRAIDENYDELEQLNNIFSYFFDAYNKTFESPLYKLQTVEEGEVFDNEKCLRTSNSNSLGEISKVIFKGYINNNSKKIERKTIVKI